MRQPFKTFINLHFQLQIEASFEIDTRRLSLKQFCQLFPLYQLPVELLIVVNEQILRRTVLPQKGNLDKFTHICLILLRYLDADAKIVLQITTLIYILNLSICSEAYSSGKCQ